MAARPPARWEILRANLAHLTSPNGEEAAIRAAAQRIEHTDAYDAALDAKPDIQRVLVGHITLPSLPPTVFTPRLAVKLIPREKQTLGLHEEHSSVKELAAALFISRNTAKSHLGRLYRSSALKIAVKRFGLGENLIEPK